MKNLHTSSGRFRAEAMASSKCGADAVATPLIGVLSSRLVGSTDIVGTKPIFEAITPSSFGSELLNLPGVNRQFEVLDG
jgi:hypothetical protein